MLKEVTEKSVAVVANWEHMLLGCLTNTVGWCKQIREFYCKPEETDKSNSIHGWVFRVRCKSAEQVTLSVR